MPPTQIVITGFSLNELPDASRRKAHDTIRERLYACFELDDLVSEWKEQLQEHGLFNVTLPYSLSNCQGDGVGIEANLDVVRFLEKHPVPFGDEVRRALGDYDQKELEDFLNNYLNARFEKSRYANSVCWSTSTEWNGHFETLPSTVIDDFVDRLEKEMKHFGQQETSRMEREGYDAIDAAQSDEEIEQYCQDHAILFDEDGRILRD